MSHQSWLEAPYTQRDQEQEVYERWCERRDLDPSEDHWDAFDADMDDAAADHADALAEARAEAREDDARWLD
jgi:hypothetical protein